MNRFLYLCILLLMGSSWVQGEEEKNRIIVCENGLEMFQWDLDFIKQAQQSIEVIPCFFGGKTACDLLEAIEARFKEVPDLQVHLLASPVLMKEKEWSIIARLYENYPSHFHLELSVQIPKFNPDLVSVDNHVKLFIVDGTYFSAGGTNLEEKHCTDGTYTPDRNPQENEVDALLAAGVRDQDIVGRGPIAKELRKLFFQLYSVWEQYNESKLLVADPATFKDRHYFPVLESGYVERFETCDRIRELAPDQIKYFMGGPHQSKNAITQEYARLIRGAKKEIILSHLYFFPVEPLFQDLMDAVNRGVKLTIVTNGVTEISPESTKLFGWGNRLSYVPMFYGQCFHFWDALYVAQLPVKETEIYEYHIRDMLIHKKTMLIDNTTFVVGSYNLGQKSAYGDYELILVIEDDKVIEDVKKVHEKDLKHSRKVTPKEAYDWYFDPFTAYIGQLQRQFGGII